MSAPGGEGGRRAWGLSLEQDLGANLVVVPPLRLPAI
jgi:hypothetical protein